MFINIFALKGRIRRLELFLSVIFWFVANAVTGTFIDLSKVPYGGYFFFFFFVCFTWVLYCQMVKRAHDLEKSAFYPIGIILTYVTGTVSAIIGLDGDIGFPPLFLIVGATVQIIAFVMAGILQFKDGIYGDNSYGKDPKGRETFETAREVMPQRKKVKREIEFEVKL